MSVLLIILILTVLFIIGAGLTFFWVFGRGQTGNTTEPAGEPTPQTKQKTRFRWSFVLLPLILLLISVIGVIYFYGKLPSDVVYNIESNDLISRNVIVLWTLVPQILLVLLSLSLTWGADKLSSSLKQSGDSSIIKIDSILMVMSNMVALPQLILVFTMLNIFSYNAFQIQLSFLSALALAIIIVSVILLSVFFVRTIRKLGGASK
ncbi:MAG: hypothetical protein JW856_04625 [Dehalococcoidales bacterium]|nr:hypothetical protein [Dehalococcoidales bacterium]